MPRKKVIDSNQLLFDFDYIEKDLILLGDLHNIKLMLPKLYDHQQEDVMKVEQRFEIGKGYLSTAGTGTGKAQPLDVKIATPKGFVKMGDLSIGDKVIGYDGKGKKINAIYPQGIKRVFKVHFQDGSFTECCKEHLWETQTLTERRQNSKPRNKLNKKWKPKVRSLEEIKNSIKERHFIPIIEAVNYRKKNFKIEPYLLGVLLGDGCLKFGSYIITTDDPEIIKYCKLPKEDTFIKRIQKNKTDGFKIKGNGKRHKGGWLLGSIVQQECKILKLNGLGSLNKFIPEKYLLGNINQRLELLQGLMDTDGTVAKGIASFCSISINLAKGVVNLVNSLGGIASISKKIIKNYNDAYIVHINLGNSFNPFKLKRKANKFKPSIKYFPKRIITKIEYSRTVQTQCISIDCKRNLYATNNYILTHNTFLGLGVIKRFIRQGKSNILIIVPTDPKAIDWIDEGRVLGLSIYKLKDINDKGIEISVTTYANFYQNDALNEKTWDLIVYDEAHYLNQNAQGKGTSYLEKHKLVSNLPSSAKNKAYDTIEPQPEGEWGDDGYREKINKWNKKLKEATIEIVEKTKVLFLSATPFAYHKSIEYADGCLFEINETLEDEEYEGGYNVARGFDKFLVEHFGYRMRYGKCTIPESGVDINLLERQFFENHVEKGVMSTRKLELAYDYSREFIKVGSDIGKNISEGMDLFYEPNFIEEFPYLSARVNKKYRFIYVNQLLECIKAKEIHTRIQQHLDLGRKIVIFHGYNNSELEHPFKFNARRMLTADEDFLVSTLNQEIHNFNVKYPHLFHMDISGLLNTREAILKHFPDAKQFNGKISKKRRTEYKEEFNKDFSFTNIFIVQVKAGKEGISLHDVTGNFPRVIINLGLPTAPTDAIQSEGRIYRSGLKSNSIYEYITLQTNFERIAFAQKIALRSKTAENLAMGDLARDLETAFKEGYINAHEDPAHEGQGVGGKENDKMIHTTGAFEKAITYYYQRGKKTAKNKSREGVDYFATPEPLGYMMVKWLNPKPDEIGMEPSAGHGAIARWFPTDTTNHFVEPSYDLSSQLEINANGTVHRHTFEDYYIGNKFDFIAMNPPFGRGGKTAVEHLERAGKMMHYSDSRLIAIIPEGSSTDKRLDEWYETRDFRLHLFISHEIKLPDIVFERAGTKTRCRIMKVGYIPNYIRDEDEIEKIRNNKRTIDLSYIEDINEFFETIKTLEL